MNIKIALAGNPNCGKTTLFNALTGSNQFVGNWPGVTVEKKEGKVKKYDDVIITDLPGIYSLSPYTPEEVIARNYLINENPNVILNIVDATNLERNLYLTTQLIEIGIPVVIALNMMDVVRKSGEEINTQELSKRLGCKIVEISALKEEGITEAVEEAIRAVNNEKNTSTCDFSKIIEKSIKSIEEVISDYIVDKRRWYAIKVFERDEKVLSELLLSEDAKSNIEENIKSVENELDDDSDSIIVNQRYMYIAELLKGCYIKKQLGKMSTSDKIDSIVTNRYLALPIFAVIMFVVYFISVTTIGAWVTDWTNDGLFGDGFHLIGVGAGEYEESLDEYDANFEIINGFISYEQDMGKDTQILEKIIDSELDTFNAGNAKTALNEFANNFSDSQSIEYIVYDEEAMTPEKITATKEDLIFAIDVLYNNYQFIEPNPVDYGVWVPGVPVLIEKGLNAINCWDWLKSLILDGVIAGVGAVLGFVPQIFVLFIFLAFLESCGYMARIAFVLDKIFRKFGLSGKSFIPMLIGTGCGIPGIMASRTIENESDRKMTIITTTFIPCSAKLPVIAMIAGAIFGGAWWVAPSAYFLGMIAIIVSGIILKKTTAFASEVAPFVMELPAYHLPTCKNILYSMWERGWSFVKKALTIILLSTIVIWFTTYFGFIDGGFRMLSDTEMDYSVLAYLGKGLSWIFAPLGFGTWQATVATITGLTAKENIVGSLGIFFGGTGTVYGNLLNTFTMVSGYSFLIFNLLCAPCMGAIGAIRREMNNAKWTLFAVSYQCGFAYVIALIFNQFGNLFTGNLNGALNIISFIFANILLIGLIYMIIKPGKKIKS